MSILSLWRGTSRLMSCPCSAGRCLWRNLLSPSYRLTHFSVQESGAVPLFIHHNVWNQISIFSIEKIGSWRLLSWLIYQVFLQVPWSSSFKNYIMHFNCCCNTICAYATIQRGCSMCSTSEASTAGESRSHRCQLWLLDGALWCLRCQLSLMLWII